MQSRRPLRPPEARGARHVAPPLLRAAAASRSRSSSEMRPSGKDYPCNEEIKPPAVADAVEPTVKMLAYHGQNLHTLVSSACHVTTPQPAHKYNRQFLRLPQLPLWNCGPGSCPCASGQLSAVCRPFCHSSTPCHLSGIQDPVPEPLASLSIPSVASVA